MRRAFLFFFLRLHASNLQFVPYLVDPFPASGKFGRGAISGNLALGTIYHKKAELVMRCGAEGWVADSTFPPRSAVIESR